MIKEITNYQRIDLFNYYHSRSNPFIILTTKLDITNIVNYCKEHRNFYATFGYLITKTANNIDAFKYRYDNGKIYYCDELRTGYTKILKDDNIGFFNMPFIEVFDEYINEYLKIEEKFMENGSNFFKKYINEIWLSCAPWFSFNSLIPPFDKEVTIPQFIWDKYESVNDKYFVNLMIMVHHGFADGYHVGQFINNLQENINLFQ